MSDILNQIAIIGDVHGKYDEYIKIARKHLFSLQLGDFGFCYDVMKKLDPSHHRLIFGNHDNYGILKNQDVPNNLGDFGFWEIPGFRYKNAIEQWGIFFVRGAWSIDKKFRVPGLSWWPNEELTVQQANAAIDLYEQLKPEFVVTHDCPESISKHVVSLGLGVIRTQTSSLLEAMREIHRPRFHVFGHHHRSFRRRIDQTQFVCLQELETMTFDLDPEKDHEDSKVPA